MKTQAPRSPTYRDLAQRTHYAASVLSVAASGHQLPSWQVTRAFVEACDGDIEEWQARWSRLRARLEATHNETILEADTSRTGSEEPLAPLTPTLEHSPEPAEPRRVAILRPTRSDLASIGPFRLLGRLGSGAMGEVYLGISKGEPPAAVKVIRPDLIEGPQFRRRFAAEITALATIDSPHIPAVIDADPTADRPWIATAYIPGPPLDEVVNTDGPLAPATVFRLAAGIATALVHIHSAGILHRDLKPANVLLDATGPVIIDFGVAQIQGDARLTQTGARVGTVPFMAPEQAEGRPVTAASDIFSLGSLLAYAATGLTPFGDGTADQVLHRIVHTDPDPAALDCHDDRLRTLIVRCLDKDPARRPTAPQIIDSYVGQPSEADWPPVSVDVWTERSNQQVAALLEQAAKRRTALRLGLGAAAVSIVAGVTIAGTGLMPSDSTAPSAVGAHRGATSPASPLVWTATSGPSCSTGHALAIDTTGSWDPLAGTATAGCGDALIHRTTDSSDGANWVFNPGAGRTCTFRIDVPDSRRITADNVTYQAWDTLPGKHYDSHRIGGNVRGDQRTNRGRAITITFGPTKNGTIDLQIYDDYADHTIEAAGTVTATCR
ncbi:serine/threonine-protein kinase [Actinomadura sp. DC4]|uniref:serine/threonine-protein kinase n=1 Tax=Actinomadura sp. DC4 TaxID=3055069 RepID=UPI0025B0407E|nr:serine/threonine-protein kinase [Actinomadura sp. DC4]MDN3354328.1 serine/threonine-protein kinase [Actinomadura sp. DC4]